MERTTKLLLDDQILKPKSMSAHHVIVQKRYCPLLFHAVSSIYFFGLPKKNYHKFYDFRLLDRFDFYFFPFIFRNLNLVRTLYAKRKLIGANLRF